MDCPSTPAAPLFALTRLYASHTSCFGILNGFTSGLDLLTRLLPDQTPGCSCDQDRMSQPLRSALITRVSSLLRAGPPARHESVLDASQFPLLGALPLVPSPNPRRGEQYRPAPSRVLHRSQRIGLTPPTCRTPPGQ